MHSLLDFLLPFVAGGLAVLALMALVMWSANKTESNYGDHRDE